MQKPTPVFVTKQKLKQLQNELNDLNSKLPEFIKHTGEMAALGDRSENAGYKEAKALMRKTQSKINYLQNLIKRAQVIQKSGNSSVSIGSKVHLQNEKGEQFKYQIVDSLQANPAQGFISFKSPLGELLINKKVGDTVKLNTPFSSENLKIQNIS